MTAFVPDPASKSLAIDESEQLVYFWVSWGNPLDVIRLGSDAGGIVDAKRQ